MKALRWIGPVILLLLLALLPWMVWQLRPQRELEVVALDNTVPFRNRIEHRSLFWLLDHLKIVKPGGVGYDADVDYIGAFPGPVPGDPPERTTELTEADALHADVLYLVDTYGVYREDLASGPKEEAALERSQKVYGGLTIGEARAAWKALNAGTTLIAEFNSMGSPTGAAAREVLEEAVGARWTRWVGRYFERLEETKDVPEWLRRDYEREWNKPWEFTGPGYVLIQDDARCEVLRVGVEAEAIGLTIERENPVDPVLEGARDAVPYPYWFDIVEARPDTQVLARFRWHLLPAGEERLRERRLPMMFPAVTRRLVPGGGTAYYFSGDFADNPMFDFRVPLAGYMTFRRWIEAIKLTPSDAAFYWRFYIPMMERILEAAPRRDTARP